MSTPRVIKLGGSLLTLPHLNEQFQAWLSENHHPLTLIVVGGGGIVDAVRDIDHANPLDEEFAHWLCIDLMQHSARITHHLLDQVDFIETPEQLQRAIAAAGQPASGPAASGPVSDPVVAIVQVGPCFCDVDSKAVLPANWSVTSDTIAAAFAIAYGADELVVMKSVDPPGNSLPVENLAAAGYVDPCFADFAKQIERVRFVNLRAFRGIGF